MIEKYKLALKNLKKELPFINSIALVVSGDVVYFSDNWTIKGDINQILSIWATKKPESFLLSGVKFLTRTCTNDRLIATSIKKDGHLVGVRANDKILLSLIEPDGIIPFATTEMVRTLSFLSDNEPYLNEDIQLGKQLNSMGQEGTSIDGNEAKVKEIIIEKTDIPFTARLMAYYRAQENKKNKPLFKDPFAERLAGDLSEYLKKHIRVSQQDYPIVRSYYIETQLLTPWCNKQKISQIILLGAGLDTKVYRFIPFQTNTHSVFEIDFSSIIEFKEEILINEEPLCELVRLSIDLSQPEWILHLLEAGFKKDIPTFWILEGFLYYIEKNEASYLLERIAEVSEKCSQIFTDVLQSSKWFPFYYDENSAGPYASHLKWGLDISYVPAFFKAAGWKVKCSWADDHDQGRDVGQKAMIFVEGIKK